MQHSFKKTNTYWNTVSAPSNEEDFYFSKSLLIDANLIYLNIQLHTTTSTLHPTSWTVKHSRPLCRQNTLIRDENDHIKVSNTQILQVGPRQTDSEESPAFCQNLALTFSPALKMLPSFNVQIGNFTAKATGETSIVPSNWHQKLKQTEFLRREACSANSWQILTDEHRTSGKIWRKIHLQIHKSPSWQPESVALIS